MSKKKLTVQLRFPGFFFEETTEKVISSLEEAERLAKHNPNCYGYKVFEQKGLICEGECYMTQPRCIKSVLFGKVYTLEQIKEMNDMEILISNLETDGQTSAIKLRSGTWLPIEKNTQIVEC